MKAFDQTELEQGYGNRFQRFQDLMRHRVRDILLVSSMYDSFILSEDGRLYEELLSEYLGLNLTHMPGITRVSSGREAIRMARIPGRFDLIITTRRLEDMHSLELARHLQEENIDLPLILLTYDSRELRELQERHDLSRFERVFMWQGDFRILLAIIKYMEDRMNVEYDTSLVGVQSIILIEDNVRFFSAYLPMVYAEMMRHTQSLIAEGVNRAHMLLRQRARPKILLCDHYEEAWEYFQKYHDTVLGVISDVKFPRNGTVDANAGFEFAKNVRAMHSDVPILIQSRKPENRKPAEQLGATFLLKNSPTLLHELSKFMKKNFGFGDFVFRLSDGSVVDSASDLRELEEKLHTVPAESLVYHGERNHFSVWLKARTEFWLAHKLRPRRVTDYQTPEDLRKYLIDCLHDLRVEQRRGIVVDYDPETFEEAGSVIRVGGGSLGGKGRGLGFVSTLLHTYEVQSRFDGVKISVPPSIILSSRVFEQFLELNNLHDFAIRSTDDGEINERFLNARLPDDVVADLADFLESFHFPLSVRSSSLLEDSQYIPFAGVYGTYMIPNSNPNSDIRLEELMCAVKRVYASTFFSHSKTYFKPTPYRLEEEKMAVIIQKLIGVRHGDRFYPDFSGVARSYNFYPIPPMKPEDGIASLALGFGKTVVEGGRTMRICPRYPRHLLQLSNINDALNDSQREFWAMVMPDVREASDCSREFSLVQFGLDVAEGDGVLAPLASTYSVENEAIYDGVSRDGVRLVTFASILKSDYFPLADILTMILDIGRRGMSSPIEIEFAVNLSVPPGSPREFHLLQMRPMVVDEEMEQLEYDQAGIGNVICESTSVLGNGVLQEIRDIVVVDPELFERSKSRIAAQEIGSFNHLLTSEGRPYILIGVGRWGSADPWLGIPVEWKDIWGARVIVECGMKDMKVAPSQGTHFFQNLTASRIGYFTIDCEKTNGHVNWEMLRTMEAAGEKRYVRHLRFDEPVTVVMNGHDGKGIIFQPR